MEESLMPPSSEVKHVFEPEDISPLAAAYDKAHQQLPRGYYEHETARRRLALFIIHAAERGERDPDQLAEIAKREFSRHL